MRRYDTGFKGSKELRFAERALTFIAFAEPFHNAVSVEFLGASFAGFLGQLTVVVDDVEANGALLHT
jgi:hypothetical protein